MDTLGPALDSLLAHVEAALKECGRPVGLANLAPGNNVVWDNCCAASDGEGQMWVRVVSSVPQPAGAQPCDIDDTRVSLAVGAVRCMSGVDQEGTPSAAEMRADTLGMTQDASILLNAIRDWPMTPHVLPKSLQLGSGLPLGPSGLCGGWEWNLSFRLRLCRGC
jgi:hypothetical protein